MNLILNMLCLESPLDTGVEMFREPKESESKIGRRDWHWGEFLIAQGECGARAYQPDDERSLWDCHQGQEDLGGLRQKWWKNGQGGSRPASISFQVSSSCHYQCVKNQQQEWNFLCFVSSLSWHMKQNGPAQIFKWRFKPPGSSVQECALHIGWHS